MLRTKRQFLLASAACALGTTPASASAYPDKPIRLLVGFAPGGGVDIVARILAGPMARFLKQSVVVENRAGAGGVIATEALAKSAPDGYTIMLNSVGPIAISPALGMAPNYDPLRDMAPITLAVTLPDVLLVNASSPVKSLQDYIGLLKKDPGARAYGSSGVGGSGHLGGELLSQMTGVELTHVGFRGGAPAMNDLLGNQIPAVLITLSAALPQIKAGKLRALAITEPERSDALPGVPAMSEAAGLQGYAAGNWYGFVAPGRTPEPILQTLNAAIVQSLKDPAIVGKLKDNGMEPHPMPSSAFGAFMKSESVKWGGIIRSRNIRLK